MTKHILAFALIVTVASLTAACTTHTREKEQPTIINSGTPAPAVIHQDFKGSDSGASSREAAREGAREGARDSMR